MKLHDRRTFFKLLTRTTANVAVASTGLYVVGSMFEELGGKLTAGAKTWEIGGSGACDYRTCDSCGYIQGTSCSSAGTTCCYDGPAYEFCTFLGGGETGDYLICQ